MNKDQHREDIERIFRDPPVAELGEVTYTQTITITCKHCGSAKVVKYGKKGDTQYYLCRDCKRTFAGTDALPGMRFPPDQIAAAIGLFYSGLSIDAIRRQLDSIYHVYPSDSTVYQWVIRYTKVAVGAARISKLQVGPIWVADETMLKLDRDVKVWFWDIIDSKTRYLLASHMSESRTTKDAEMLMERAYRVAGKAPRVVYTDKLASYLDGIELTCGADTRHRPGGPFDIENNTNLIERFHGTLKARTKVMRGLHSRRTARLIMDGWLIHYNYFRPHEALKDLAPKGIEKTPAQVAKADYHFKNWKDVIIIGREGR